MSPHRTSTAALWRVLVLVLLVTACARAQRPVTTAPILDERRLAREAFGADAPWYLQNIPFLEIDDPEIQRIYYYRWQVYRSHLREIGQQGTDETEFLTDVPWARHPYTDLNDSSSFHILEGRWLRDTGFVKSLVDHLYTGGGNDRHFSESIAAATFAWTQVTGDPAPAVRHLDTMQHIYNLWDDHFDSRRGLYWIEPLLDATEYTISSIDASGAGFTERPSTRPDENGFMGGYAYRPSINAYQFANALAIAQLAQLAGRKDVAAEYESRAAHLRTATLQQLWNPALGHFTDVYQRSTKYVEAGTFIRGRELVGFVPWMYNLPTAEPGEADRPDYNSAWRHVLKRDELAGPYGLRTVEPTYARYLHQYRYDAATGLPECQWNGPAWPFQTSQALTGMANLLQAPKQSAATVDDYVHLLRQYTRLHLLENGTSDIQEDYNPDTGKPIVGLPRSHHYNHSTYNDLILSGLIGIRPRTDDVLELNPLLPTSGSAEQPIRYFALEDLRYHGRDLAIVYDVDGRRYGRGAGLSVFSSGRRIYGPRPLSHVVLSLSGQPRAKFEPPPLPIDLAVNVWERAPTDHEPNLPIASASSSAPGASPYQAIDGRLWFFPEIANGWSPEPADRDSAWFAVDLRRVQRIGRVELAFASDGRNVQAPVSVRLQSYAGGEWVDVPGEAMDEQAPVANGITHIRFPGLECQQLRILLKGAPEASMRLVEFEAFSTSRRN